MHICYVSFDQIFRALRSILHGLVAFLAACNRHRLRYDIDVSILVDIGLETSQAYPNTSKPELNRFDFT